MEGCTHAEDNDWSLGRLTFNKRHWRRLAGLCNQLQSADAITVLAYLPPMRGMTETAVRNGSSS